MCEERHAGAHCWMLCANRRIARLITAREKCSSVYIKALSARGLLAQAERKSTTAVRAEYSTVSLLFTQVGSGRTFGRDQTLRRVLRMIKFNFINYPRVGDERVLSRLQWPHTAYGRWNLMHMRNILMVRQLLETNSGFNQSSSKFNPDSKFFFKLPLNKTVLFN